MKIRKAPAGYRIKNKNKIASPLPDKSNVTVVPKLKTKTGKRVHSSLEYTLPEEKLKLMNEMILNGAGFHEISKALSVSELTVSYHSTHNPDIASSVKTGRDAADKRVENSLYKRACGFELREETWEPMIIRVAGKAPVLWSKDLALTKVVKKYQIPDVMAAHLWLRNRKTADWSKKVDEDSGVNVNVHTNVVQNNIKPEEVTDDTRRRVAENFRILQRYGDLASVPS